MLEVKNITKRFSGQERPAVEDVSFTVRPGEIAALLGENGAGKTTTLRIISTILRPENGTCSVMGHDVVKEPAKARSQIGMLLGGETGLYDRLTARENIGYFADLHGIPRERQKKDIATLAALLGMKEYLDKRCGTFSRGMKQKTAFARALIHNPRIILLDEPTTGLDVSASITVRNFILGCRKEGRAILFSSHNIEEVRKLADRIIIIHNGKITENAAPDDICARYGNDLEKAFLDITGLKTGDAENG